MGADRRLRPGDPGRRRAPAHRLRPRGRRALRGPHRRRVPGPGARPPPAAGGRGAAASRAAAGRFRAERRPRPRHRRLLEGHEAEAPAHRRPAARAAGPAPGRAAGRPRRLRPGGPEAGAARPGGGRLRRRLLLAHPRGGREALHPGRDPHPWQGGRAGEPAGARRARRRRVAVGALPAAHRRRRRRGGGAEPRGGRGRSRASTRRLTMWTDPLLRALGADPQVFRPVYRVQKILLDRGVRLVRQRGRRPGSFLLVCLLAAVYGIVGLLFLYKTRVPVLGGGLALTCGCAYLLMVVLADHAEALVLPRERLVLAAHPQDDRSLLLAKLVAVGRSLALLSACLFLPPCLVVAHWWGAGGVLAFLAGAAGAAFAAATSGILVAVLLVRSGGKRAMERVMPWLQTAFQLTFFLPTVANVF